MKSFKIAEKGGSIIAYQLEAKKTTQPKTPAKKKKVNNDDNGYTLVVKNLSTGKQNTYGFVKDYAFAKYGHSL